MVKRKPNGQFDKGSSKPANSGRKVGQNWKERVREIFLDCVTEDDYRAIIRVQVEAAKAGDKDASKLILPFIIPKPPEEIRHTGSGGGPIQLTEVWVSKTRDDSDTD